MSQEPNYPPPLGTAVPNTPAAPNPPQSPSGSVTGESAIFNFDNSVTSTQNFLQNELQPESAQEGVPSLTSTPVLAGVTPGALQWTNPVQDFNPFAGYGSQGDKFS
jgi:hypothetical protein